MATSGTAGAGGAASVVASRKGLTGEKPAVPEKPILAVDVAAVDEAGLLQLAIDLSYDAFNTKRIRGIVIRTIEASKLIQILTACAHVGNNSSRLESKAHNPDVAKKIAKLIGDCKIKPAGATGPNDLTLARIATSFAPLFYVIRKTVKKALQNQDLGTGLDPEWQSPSLAMYHGDVANMMPWLLAFGKQIKPKGEDDLTTAARTKAFADLARTNMSKDDYLAYSNTNKSIMELLDLAYKTE
jgi:hypothetical protein